MHDRTPLTKEELIAAEIDVEKAGLRVEAATDKLQKIQQMGENLQKSWRTPSLGPGRLINPNRTWTEVTQRTDAATENVKSAQAAHAELRLMVETRSKPRPPAPDPRKAVPGWRELSAAACGSAVQGKVRADIIGHACAHQICRAISVMHGLQWQGALALRACWRRGGGALSQREAALARLLEQPRHRARRHSGTRPVLCVALWAQSCAVESARPLQQD